MILTIETALHGIAATLAERIAPAIDDPFAGEAARLAGMLLTLNANWVDDAAAVRMAEIRSIRTLFADAAPLVADVGLRARLAEAGAGGEPGLRISELDRACNALRQLLAEMHAHVEASENGEARLFGQQIWRMLGEFETARAPRA